MNYPSSKPPRSSGQYSFIDLPKSTPTLTGLPIIRPHPTIHPPPLPQRARDRRISDTVPSAEFFPPLTESCPPPPMESYHSSHPPSGTPHKVRRVSLPIMNRIPDMPSEGELTAAQNALDEADGLIPMRDALMKVPRWVPVGEAVRAVSHEIRRYRAIAAQLLRCDPLELEE